MTDAQNMLKASEAANNWGLQKTLRSYGLGPIAAASLVGFSMVAVPCRAVGFSWLSTLLLSLVPVFVGGGFVFGMFRGRLTVGIMLILVALALAISGVLVEVQLAGR